MLIKIIFTALILLLLTFRKKLTRFYNKLKKFLHKPQECKTHAVDLIDLQKGFYFNIKKNSKNTSKFQVAIGFWFENIHLERFIESVGTSRRYMENIAYVTENSNNVFSYQIKSTEDMQKTYKDEKVFKDFTRLTKLSPQAYPTDIYKDVSDELKGNKKKVIEFVQNEMINKSIDVNVGPGTRFCLLKYGNNKYIAFSFGNHLFVDGPYVIFFWRVIATLYSYWFIPKFILIRLINFNYGLERTQEELINYIKKHYPKKQEEKDLIYWKKELKETKYNFEFGIQPNLKYDKHEGSRVNFTFGEVMYNLVKQIVIKTESRDFVVLYSLFNCWMKKTFLSNDICSFYATSILPKNFFLSGLYATPMLMRVKFDENSTFMDVVKNVSKKRKVERNMKWLSFSKLVKNLGEEVSIPNIMFGVTVFKITGLNFGKGVKSEMADLQNFGEIVHDFGLLYQEFKKQFQFCFEFKFRVFEEFLVKEFVESFVHFSRELLNNPNKKITEINLLDKEQYKKQIVEWNKTKKDYPLDKTFLQIFDKIVKNTPNNISVGFKEEKLTYNELDKKSNQVANLLLKKYNIKKGDFVGVLFNKSKELIIAILAVLKSGGIYLPLDPSLPNKRFDLIMKNTNCSIIITHEKVFEKFNIIKDKLIFIEDSKNCSVKIPDVEVTPEDLAYIIYTSGSTGIPKGVLIKHKSLVNTSLNLVERFFIDKYDSFAFYLSIEFDGHIAEVFPTLICGKKLEVIPEDIRLDPNHLINYFEKYKVGGCIIPPTMLSNFPSVKKKFINTIIVAGEKSDQKTMNFWSKQVDNFVNAYGPTEIAVCSHTKLWKSGNPNNIGTPLNNVKHYILDKNYNPVPIGMPGELCIGGYGVAKGYFKLDDQTNRKFIKNPFLKNDRIYLSGDKCYFNEDGDVIFIGRMDYQIKIKGRRIELGEIEHSINQNSNVKRAVVIHKDKQLYSFIIPKEELMNYIKIEDWKKTFDELDYTKDLHKTLNIEGWISSYTGKKISRKHLEEQVNETTKRIKSLNFNPNKNVLEVGCGNGLIFSRIVPECSEYMATDLSKNTIDFIKNKFKHIKNLIIRLQEANNFKDIKDYYYDVIILNSVIQYFPSFKYLITVIEGCIKATKPGGHIFIGDVRNFSLLNMLHFSLQEFKGNPIDSISSIIQRAEKFSKLEKELLVDPNFFHVLKDGLNRISHVKIEPKRGKFENEITKFRYNVILTIEKKINLLQNIKWIDYNQQKLNLKKIEDLINNSNEQLIAIKNIKNRRLKKEFNMLNLIRKNLVRGKLELLRKEESKMNLDYFIHPYDLFNLKTNYSVDVNLNLKNSDCFDIIFYKGLVPKFEVDVIKKPYKLFVNDIKIELKIEKRLKGNIIKELKESLSENAIPKVLLFLKSFPMNNRGKVNREKLKLLIPKRIDEYEIMSNYYPANTDTEKKLVEMWKLYLPDVNKVGIYENFFELGGHSILAQTFLSEVLKKFQVKITLFDFYNAPTIFQTGKIIDSIKSKKTISNIIKRDNTKKKDRILSTNQRLLLSAERFASRIKGIPNIYIIPYIAHIRGKLDIVALENSINDIIKRHESLRSIIKIDDVGRVLINVKDDVKIKINVVNGLNVEEFMHKELRTKFDFEKGPLIRVSLLKITNIHFVFSFITHHIVFDLVSFVVFSRELEKFYLYYTEHISPKLEKNVFQYSDFLACEKKYIDLKISEGKITKFWTNILKSIPHELEFPTDKKKIRTSFSGQILYSDINNNLFKQICQFGKKNNVTNIITFLSVYQILLSNYSRQKKFAVGLTFSNRNYGNSSGIIGFLTNTLPFPVDLEEDLTFVELVNKVKTMYYKIIENQDLPFAKIIELTKSKKSHSFLKTPIFQYLFYMITITKDLKLNIKNVDIEEKFPNFPISKFNMIFMIFKRSTKFKIGIKYSTELFSNNMIKRLISHYNILLKKLMVNPKVKINTVSMLTDEEYKKIVYDWNNNMKDYPNKTLIEMFENIVENYPSKIAVECEKEKITYNELNRRSNQAARLLKEKHNIKKGSFVGISIDRSIDLIVYIFGVLKMGGIYFPIDSTMPENRLKYMINDTKCDIIVMSKEFEEKFKFFKGKKVVVENTNIDNYKKENLNIKTWMNDITYIIYTSGSTGNPKGVLIYQKSLKNNVHSHADSFKYPEDERIGFFCNIVWDVSVSDIFVPLLCGLTLIIIPEKIRKSPQKIVDYFEKMKITSIRISPSVLKLLPVKKIPSLRQITTLGEMFDEKAREWKKKGVKIIVNAYGPTETTIDTHFKIITPDISSTNIGRQYPNCNTYILNEFMLPVPVGVPGEIYIGGVQTAKGYLNLEKKTNETFLASPFVKNDIIYKTGDLGYYLNNGDIIYLNRIDFQIKIGGYRIELTSIENRLKMSTYVKDVIVLVRNKKLVAYIILNNINMSKKELIQKLKNVLKKDLPSYMIPAFFQFVEEFPLNHNNKTDRNQLLKLNLDVEKIKETITSPSTEIERILLDVFKEISKIPSIELDDNMFSDLGIDSLSLQIIYKKLTEKHGITLNMEDFYENSTISSLAKVIKTKSLLNFEIPKEHCKLLPQQLDCLELKEPDHNNINMLISSKDIKIDILKNALIKLIENHSSFRLRFYQNKNKEWYQIYKPQNYDDCFIVKDYSTLSKIIIPAKIKKESFNNQNTLSLKDGKLLKVIVFKLKGSLYTILFICHKIIFDFNSLMILINDLEKIYLSLCIKKPYTIKKTHPFGRYSELIAGSSYINEKKFWKSQCPMKSQVLYPKLTKSVKFSNQTYIRINYSGLQKITKHVRISEEELFLMAYIKTIKSLINLSDVWIDIVNDNRKVYPRQILLSSTIGNISRTYPLLFKNLPENLEDLMLSVKLKNRIVPNSGIGFGVLKKSLNIKESPLFCFNYIGKFEKNKKFNFDYFKHSISKKNKRKYLIDIHAGYTNSELIIYIDYTKEKNTFKTFKKLLKKNVKELVMFCSEEIKEIVYDDSENPKIVKLLINLINNPQSIEETLILSDVGKPIIWFFHPVIGFSNCYMNIAMELTEMKSNISIYGLNYPYLLDLSKTFESLEKMVEYYIEIIKKIQPDGPYYLGGFSLGGLLAIEACKQLGDVEKLFIFDPPPNEKILYPDLILSNKNGNEKIKKDSIIDFLRLEESEELKPLIKYYKNSVKSLYEVNHVFKIVEKLMHVTNGYLFNGVIKARNVIFLRANKQLKTRYDNLNTFLVQFTRNWLSCFETIPIFYTSIGKHDDIVNKENSKRISEIINYEIYKGEEGKTYNLKLTMEKNAKRVNDEILLNLIKNI